MKRITSQSKRVALAIADRQLGSVRGGSNVNIHSHFVQFDTQASAESDSEWKYVPVRRTS